MASDKRSSTKPTDPNHQPSRAARGGCSVSRDADAGGPPPEWEGFSVVDRRSGVDRREMNAALGSGGTESVDTGLERRRGPGRRRSDFAKAAEEGEMTREQFLFVQAIEAFKRVNGRTFPSWTDVLEVIRLLGYRKTMPSGLNLPQCEDWRESAEAPAGCAWSKRGSSEAA